MIRNAMFRRVELVARDDLDGLMALERAAADRTDPPREVVMTRSAWDAAHRGLLRRARHASARRRRPRAGAAPIESPRASRRRAGGHRAGACARPSHDPAGHHDWVIDAVVDLDASDEAGELVLATVAMHRL